MLIVSCAIMGFYGWYLINELELGLKRAFVTMTLPYVAGILAALS
jgi:hypothetical protein